MFSIASIAPIKNKKAIIPTDIESKLSLQAGMIF
jgi:hypothetical protein